MSSLRSKVIRLAHQQPALRPHLLPLLVRTAGNPDAAYMDALENLSDLSDLTENVQDVIDGFHLHYASGRVAGMDPKIKSEYEVLTKAQEGQKLADQTVKSLENLVRLFPEEAKYAKALADARKMHEKLTKQVAASAGIIRTLAKKIAPKALADFAKKVEAKVKSRLIDPSQVEFFFTQTADYRGNAASYFVVKATVPEQRGPIRVWIRELVTGTPGLSMGLGSEPNYIDWTPATVDGAADLFVDEARGWMNIKGEAEGQAARSGTAQVIARALDGVTSRLLAYGRDRTEISPDFRKVIGAYRSSLPREGAYSVGEYKYESMVAEEIAHARKAVDSALAPYKSQIARVDVYAGEKSWIHIQVTLK
jgi:hypothetical protein